MNRNARYILLVRTNILGTVTFPRFAILSFAESEGGKMPLLNS